MHMEPHETAEQTPLVPDMTREEIFRSLYSGQVIYRPPLERDSALLEVATGCNWGKCRFCDFRRDRHHVFSLEEIEYKAALLSRVIEGNPKLHLLGCNPFCLPEDRLLAILDMVHRHLPSVEEVSMYARADDILEKGPDGLRRLRDAGVFSLHVGLESGSDRVLALHNKGETAAEIEDSLHALTAAGIYYHVTAIPGLGGKAWSEEHRETTAALLSRLMPLSIWCIMLKVWPDTPLDDMVREGSFAPMIPAEILAEEIAMIRDITLNLPCLYVDSTVLNRYTIMGMLPDNKDAMLARMMALLEQERTAS